MFSLPPSTTSKARSTAELLNARSVLFIELAAVDGNLSPEEALGIKYRADEELVKTKLPPQYQEFVPLFSRRDSDVLAERRPGVDHKIEPIGPVTGGCPTPSCRIEEHNSCRLSGRSTAVS